MKTLLVAYFLISLSTTLVISNIQPPAYGNFTFNPNSNWSYMNNISSCNFPLWIQINQSQYDISYLSLQIYFSNNDPISSHISNSFLKSTTSSYTTNAWTMKSTPYNLTLLILQNYTTLMSPVANPILYIKTNLTGCAAVFTTNYTTLLAIPTQLPAENFTGSYSFNNYIQSLLPQCCVPNQMTMYQNSDNEEEYSIYFGFYTNITNANYYSSCGLWTSGTITNLIADAYLTYTMKAGIEAWNMYLNTSSIIVKFWHNVDISGNPLSNYSLEIDLVYGYINLCNASYIKSNNTLNFPKLSSFALKNLHVFHYSYALLIMLVLIGLV